MISQAGRANQLTEGVPNFRPVVHLRVVKPCTLQVPIESNIMSRQVQDIDIEIIPRSGQPDFDRSIQVEVVIEQIIVVANRGDCAHSQFETPDGLPEQFRS